MIKVLFVCLGNICRSPMAEAIFNLQVKRMGLTSLVESESCGTSAYQIGKPPDKRTMVVMNQMQIPLLHTARQIARDDFIRSDYIVAMDNFNYQDVIKLQVTTKLKAKVMLMSTFDNEKDALDVPDPYHGEIEDFYKTYAILERSCIAFLQHIVKENQLIA